jgi:hypothetical protein
VDVERPPAGRIGASGYNGPDAIRIRGGRQSSAIPYRPDARIRPGGGDGGTFQAVADATARAIERIGASIGQPGGLEAVNLQVAEKFVDALGRMAKENNTMIVPANLVDVSTLVAAATSVVRRQADRPGGGAGRTAG